MRLFVGLPIPVDIAQSLSRAARSIHLPQPRWTAPENLHLTLVFLGEVAEAKLPAIIEQLQSLSLPPLQIRLTSFGTFPRAGILLAEIDPDPKLMQLQAQVSARMAACGFPPEERPYRPHLTLARSRQPVRLDCRQSKLPAQFEAGFKAAAVNLYRSDPTPTGSRYQVLATRNVSQSPG